MASDVLRQKKQCTLEETRGCVRRAIRKHLLMQRCLNCFNDAFAYLIILFVLQVSKVSQI